jgi:hypothetical protein
LEAENLPPETLGATRRERSSQPRNPAVETGSIRTAHGNGKLFDTCKVTDAIKAVEVRISSHANVKPVTWRNSDDIANCYDLGASVQEARPIRFIATSSFIASYLSRERASAVVWMVCTSRRTRKKIASYF